MEAEAHVAVQRQMDGWTRIGGARDDPDADYPEFPR